MKKINLIFAIFIFLATASLQSGDEFTKLHTWRFENVTYFTDASGKTVLPWEIYTRAFIGICKDSNTAKVLCPLDYAFYKAYNAAFAIASGNCFGMSLLANIIYKEEGHLGFCKPIYTYSGDYNGPASAKLCTTITVMQCHEWSHAGILWIAENITGTHPKDPNYAYKQIEYYLSMGDLPLITLVKNDSMVGHTLIPYRLKETASKRYIYLYDPNKWYPPDSDFYDNNKNYIEIDRGSGNWSYEFKPGEIWGSPDGYIFATPMSIVKPPSRNPLQLGGITDALNHIFLTGANIAQITDGEGHKFYKTSGSSHTRLSDIEDNPRLRIKNLFRMPVNSAKRGSNIKEIPEIYFAINSLGKDLNFEIASRGEKYNFEIAGKDNIIKLTSQGGLNGRDLLNIKKLSTLNEEIELTTKRSNPNFEIEIYKKLPEKEMARRFKISNLSLPGSIPIKIRLSKDRESLLVKGEKESITCNLEITQVIGNKITKMPVKVINVPGKDWHEVSPSDWDKLNDATIKINKLPITPQLPKK
ncbi:MAG: hypothetical protein ABIN61_05075 [candidate division WOR-3 bacterium]